MDAREMKLNVRTEPNFSGHVIFVLGVLYQQRYFCKRHFLVINFFHAQSYNLCQR